MARFTVSPGSSKVIVAEMVPPVRLNVCVLSPVNARIRACDPKAPVPVELKLPPSLMVRVPPDASTVYELAYVRSPVMAKLLPKPFTPVLLKVTFPSVPPFWVRVAAAPSKVIEAMDDPEYCVKVYEACTPPGLEELIYPALWVKTPSTLRMFVPSSTLPALEDAVAKEPWDPVGVIGKVEEVKVRVLVAPADLSTTKLP